MRTCAQLALAFASTGAEFGVEDYMAPTPDWAVYGATEAGFDPVRYCTALHCTVLHCTALYCTALHCTVLYCTALYCCGCGCGVVVLGVVHVRMDNGC